MHLRRPQTCFQPARIQYRFVHVTLDMDESSIARAQVKQPYNIHTPTNSVHVSLQTTPTRKHARAYRHGAIPQQSMQAVVQSRHIIDWEVVSRSIPMIRCVVNAVGIRQQQPTLPRRIQPNCRGVATVAPKHFTHSVVVFVVDSCCRRR